MKGPPDGEGLSVLAWRSIIESSPPMPDAKKPSLHGRLPYQSNRQCRACSGLFRRRRGEDLAPSWLGFRLGFRRLLGFFSTFVFASHEWQCATVCHYREGPMATNCLQFL